MRDGRTKELPGGLLRVLVSCSRDTEPIKWFDMDLLVSKLRLLLRLKTPDLEFALVFDDLLADSNTALGVHDSHEARVESRCLLVRNHHLPFNCRAWEESRELA